MRKKHTGSLYSFLIKSKFLIKLGFQDLSKINKGKDGILLLKTLGIVSNVFVEEFLESVNVAYLQPQRNNE